MLDLDQPRVPITARLVADLLTTAGADRVLTVDLHAGQIQGFFNIPVDELTALPILARYFRARNTALLSSFAQVLTRSTLLKPTSRSIRSTQDRDGPQKFVGSAFRASPG